MAILSRWAKWYFNKFWIIQIQDDNNRKKTADGNTKDVERAIPLKCLNNCWTTHGMSLTNCEINLILIWSPEVVILSAIGATKFTITDTKLYASVVTFSTHDNAILLHKWKPDL